MQNDFYFNFIGSFIFTFVSQEPINAHDTKKTFRFHYDR